MRGNECGENPVAGQHFFYMLFLTSLKNKKSLIEIKKEIFFKSYPAKRDANIAIMIKHKQYDQINTAITHYKQVNVAQYPVSTQKKKRKKNTDKTYAFRTIPV